MKPHFKLVSYHEVGVDLTGSMFIAEQREDAARGSTWKLFGRTKGYFLVTRPPLERVYAIDSARRIEADMAYHLGLA